MEENKDYRMIDVFVMIDGQYTKRYGIIDLMSSEESIQAFDTLEEAEKYAETVVEFNTKFRESQNERLLVVEITVNDNVIKQIMSVPEQEFHTIEQTVKKFVDEAFAKFKE